MPIGAPTTIHNALPPARACLQLRVKPGAVLAVCTLRRLSTIAPILVTSLPRPALVSLRRGVGAVPLNSFSGPVYQIRPGRSLRGQRWPVTA